MMVPRCCGLDGFPRRRPGTTSFDRVRPEQEIWNGRSALGEHYEQDDARGVLVDSVHDADIRAGGPTRVREVAAGSFEKRVAFPVGSRLGQSIRQPCRRMRTAPRSS